MRARSVRGTWWRLTPANADPLHLPEEPPDGRWQRGATVAGLYLADSAETAWAEWYRYLAELQLAPLAGMPRELWRFQIDLHRVADLLQLEALQTLGIAAPVPERGQWREHQVVGEALHVAGWPALLAPSAARPTGAVLCVFRSQREVEGAEPVAGPELISEPPAPPRGMQT